MRFRSCATILHIAIFIMLGSFSSEASDIYYYIDENGVYHYSNTPTSEKYIPMNIGPMEKTSPPDTIYDAIIREAAAQNELQFALIKAIIKAESNFDPKAVSRAGAMGLMQIMPTNLEAFEISDPFDPQENIRAGSRYIRQLLARYNQNLHLALAAYNAGPTAVDRHSTIPPYRETWIYIQRVLAHYDRYSREEQ